MDDIKTALARLTTPAKPSTPDVSAEAPVSPEGENAAAVKPKAEADPFSQANYEGFLEQQKNGTPAEKAEATKYIERFERLYPNLKKREVVENTATTSPAGNRIEKQGSRNEWR